MAIVLGIAWLFVTVIFLFCVLYFGGSAHTIRKEKKIIKHYAELTKDIPRAGSKLITTMEIGKSNSAKCPYCNSSFKVESGRCPSCGANISKVDNKIIITKTAENTEILEALKNEHEEKMMALKNERSKQRNTTIENIVGLFFVVIVAIAIFGLMIYLIFRK